MKRLTMMSAVVALLLGVYATTYSRPAEAQILLVTGKYRIVSVDEGERRFGVALPEDDPQVRQNWIYIDNDTKMVVRTYAANGYFKDEFITEEGMYDVLRNHRGDVIRIHGGRDWDGSIDAKKIWM
ncbi:MAG: hypothetical protein AB7S38_33625 [Vulcanimicrobiota bacterium]